MMVRRGITQLMDAIEGRVFDLSVSTPREGGQGGELGRTLLPPLDDELVLKRIWPLLHRRVNVSLLWRLRRVSRSWKEKVGTSMEWAALEVVRLDSPGYLRYLAERRERRPSMQERVETEMSALRVLLSERLDSFGNRSEKVQPYVDGLGMAMEGPRRHQAEIGSEESEVDSFSVCNCRRWRDESCESSADMRGGDLYRSEDGQVVMYASSTDDSLREYYPRHVMRVS